MADPEGINLAEKIIRWNAYSCLQREKRRPMSPGTPLFHPERLSLMGVDINRATVAELQTLPGVEP